MDYRTLICSWIAVKISSPVSRKNKNAMGVIISYGDETLYQNGDVGPTLHDRCHDEVCGQTEMEDHAVHLLHQHPIRHLSFRCLYRIQCVSRLYRKDCVMKSPSIKRMLPPILMMMVGILGLFAMVSLIGQERSDATIRAFRVTPTGMWGFLFSKHLMLLAVSCITFSILYLPVMGTFEGYLASLVLILLTVIFGSTTRDHFGYLYGKSHVIHWFCYSS